MVEMRIVLGEEKKHLLVFRCEDVKHKRDLIQQFRLIQFEACPKDPLRGFNWQVVSSIRKTKSDCELQQAEDAHQYAQFATHQCPSGSQKSRPDDLIKICQAPENPTIFLGVPKPANTEDSSLVGCAAENAQMSNIEAGVERACEAL